MADIFISYARADKVRVERLVAALQARGWNVWWDTAVSPGEEFDDVIAAALERAKAVLVVWTPASVASRWVRGEARVGADRGILVPVRFDGALLPIDARAIHTIDLDEWDYDSHSPALQQVCQSIAALLSGAAPSAGTPSVPEPMQTAKPSLAVMPFVNLSGDPQQDYFADGMMEEIVTALSRVRSIFVIASGSTLCFKGKAVGAQAVGRQLGVRYLLEGSVRRSGDRVRIAPKLVDAADGSQIWAERYDGTLEDVFTLQDQVALNVVGAIVPTVQNAEIRRASSRPTANMGGYDLFLRALALVSAYEKPEAFEALDLLDRAIALDSRYALAMALAAYTHAQVVVSGWSDDPARHRRLALDLARRAVQLADDDSEVLSWVTGAYLPLDENFDDSIVLIDRSIALNPGSSLAWLMSGWLRAAAGDSDRAVEHFEMSMRLDPCSSDRGYQLSGIALARFGQSRYAEAAALLKESLQLQPTVSINQALLAACYGHLGEVDAARAAIASYQALSSRELDTRVTLFRKPEHRKAYLDGISLARPGD